MRSVVLSVILVLLFFCSSAQNQNNRWYFGRFAGVDFNSSPAKALTDGKLNTLEGCASIADKDGNLLFYTDGKTIWNKFHFQMKNGVGLLGDESATQSAIIVSNPFNTDIFFVFTCGILSQDINYSIVDMKGDDGLGEVTSINNLLLKSATEKITAIRHANGKDIWVVGHKYDSDNFYAWLISASGISGTPVISAAGTGGTATGLGTLKASIDGKTIVSAGNINDKGFVELLSFDASTGVVNSPLKLVGFSENHSVPYGLEFSPNGKLLYISEYNGSDKAKIYQVKLPVTAGLVTDNGVVLASIVTAGALQLAPNGKIYLSQKDHGALHAINFPNKLGAAAGFELDALPLGGRNAKQGLPAFNLISNDNLSIEASNICAKDMTRFKLISFTQNDDTFIWDFGDAASGIQNTSEDKLPVHQYQQPGNYDVTVTIFVNGIPQSYTQKVTILPAIGSAPILKTDNAALCDTGKIIITASGSTAVQQYNWYDESKTLIEKNNGTLKTPSILKSTSFYAAITNGICEGEMAKIDIAMNKPSVEIMATDTIINPGETVILTASGGTSYNWLPGIYLNNDNQATVISKPLKNTTYTVTVSNAFGCSATKSIRVVLIPNIFVPNTFTPNGDGINDQWVIKELVGLSNVVQVYNRLGNMVYTSKNYDNTWNGTYNGKNLPAGTYYYVITVAKFIKSGSLTILR